MKIEGQILASTHLDSQGEKLTKEELDEFRLGLPQKLTLYFNHEMSGPVTGIAQNFKLIPTDDGNNWLLLGDVETEDPERFKSFGGMSVSFVSALHEKDNALISIAVPFPHYNDLSFTSSLANIDKVSVEKWRKKSASLNDTAIIIPFLVFVLQPAWQDLYSKFLSPVLSEILRSGLHKLQNRGLQIQFHQRLKYNGRIVELKLFADDKNQPRLLDDAHLIQAITLAETVLDENVTLELAILRIIFKFDRIGRKFAVSRIEFSDGTVAEF